MKYKSIIIEDEEPARMLIKNYLKELENLELSGEYSDGFSGVKAIDELKPDLVFLDIQMPKLNGFEVLELITHRPAVIFTTAFDEFAIKAFEVNAVDYLLKPFTRERFAAAVAKAIELIINGKSQGKNINNIIKAAEENPEVLERVAIKSGTKVNVIPVNDIVYLEAMGDYVKIYTNESFFLKEKTMKYFENKLDNNRFVRIHRSFIVNINEIARIEYYDRESHVVFLKNGVKLHASTQGYQQLKKVLNL